MLQILRDRRASVLEQEAKDILLVSSRGYAVLDSGCGKSVIGKDTLSQFRPLLLKAGTSS